MAGSKMTNEELLEILQHPTCDIPTAGRALGFNSRAGSYQAAARGQIKTLNMGRKKPVPTTWLAQQLGVAKL